MLPLRQRKEIVNEGEKYAEILKDLSFPLENGVESEAIKIFFLILY